jgi:aspartate/methionine/tyrosine aminotransferase
LRIGPIGSVYSKEVLEKVITIAEKHSLMIFSDEIYFRLVFSGKEHVHMAELAHNRVPLVVLRGLSKDVPWPGGRCGWIEFHNTHLSKEFKQYCESVKKRVLLEVCATMLPQMILPRIYNHPNFPAWNASYTEELHGVADDIGETLKQIPELLVNKTEGAFYMMPRFKDGVLNNKQTLPIKNAAVRKLVEEAVSAANFPLDKRFTYYLLAHTGIVSVPASDFFSPTPGFRLTTLERDPAKRKQTYEMFVQATKQYLAS